MEYLGMTQALASWALGKPAVFDALLDLCREATSKPSEFRGRVLAEGPLRIAGDATGTVLLVWHVDYLSGTGEERWGFVGLSSEWGILHRASVASEVLERQAYVLNQRLLGLRIEGSLIHRQHDNGTHTYIAARGTFARQMSVGYVERSFASEEENTKAILFVGPSNDFASLTKLASEESAKLATLVQIAGEMIDGRPRLSIADDNTGAAFRAAVRPYFRPLTDESELQNVQVTSERPAIGSRDAGAIHTRTYREWMSPASSLTDVQRRLIEAFPLRDHPVRIIGPAGSGKTLLMQLLAIRAVELAASEGAQTRVLYVAHNSSMAQLVRQRFEILVGMDSVISPGLSQLHTRTLAEYGREQLGLSDMEIIDRDANQSKEFQREVIEAALASALASRSSATLADSLFRVAGWNKELREALVSLLMAEISTVIKGQGLAQDPARYVSSERRFSRLHGALKEVDRQIVIDVFTEYQEVIQSEYGVLDADDIALSLLSRLKAPLWELKRKVLGYDFVFVDETQLFNENERRVFPLLTSGRRRHIPIALALDEAQDVYGYTYAGMSALGVRDIQNEKLESVQRSTRAIIRLAFFVIQQTTDLFSADFPDFTHSAKTVIPDSHELARPPRLVRTGGGGQDFGNTIVDLARELRQRNLRRVAVVVHAEIYWPVVSRAMRRSDLPTQELLVRGEKLTHDQPTVVLSKPQYVGGQEFDACILVGLELGVYPPKIDHNEPLSNAVEQQALRETYLSLTRARYQVIVAVNSKAKPTNFISAAVRAGLLEE